MEKKKLSRRIIYRYIDCPVKSRHKSARARNAALVVRESTPIFADLRRTREPGVTLYLSTVTAASRYQFRLLLDLHSNASPSPPAPLARSRQQRSFAVIPHPYVLSPDFRPSRSPPPGRFDPPDTACPSPVRRPNRVFFSPNDHVEPAPNFYPVYSRVKAFRADPLIAAIYLRPVPPSRNG